MKNIRIIFLLAACVLVSLSSCHKNGNDPGPATTLITIQADVGIASADRWVVISDADGNLLEFSKFSAGDNLDIKSTKVIPGSKVTVSTIEMYSNGSGGINTYGSVVLGKTLRVAGPIDYLQNFSSVGTITITVTGAPTLMEMDISNSRGSTTSTVDLASTTLSGVVYSEETSYFLRVTDASGNSKFKVLDGITDSENLSISYTDLTSYSGPTSFTFPTTNQYHLTIDGFSDMSLTNTRQGYNVGHQLGGGGPMTQLTGSYVSVFPSYRTHLDVATGNYAYSYDKSGPAPTGDVEIASTPNPYTVMDSSPTNFTVSTSLAFNTMFGYWSGAKNNTHMYWLAWAPNSSLKVSGLPREITDKYPDLAGLEYNLVSSSLTYQGETYNDFITRLFTFDLLTPYETWSVKINN